MGGVCATCARAGAGEIAVTAAKAMTARESEAEFRMRILLKTISEGIVSLPRWILQ
jgi:hypothetical protein